MNRKAEAASTIYLGCHYTLNFVFNEFNNVDVNMSNHTIGSTVNYSFIFFPFWTSHISSFKTMAVFSPLLSHYIISSFIRKVSALNEEHYSNICETVWNI